MLTNQDYLFYLLYALIITALIIIFWLMKKKRKSPDPQQGDPVGAGVAIIYSPAYAIQLFHWLPNKTALYSKYEKIGAELLEERIVTFDRLYIPQTVSMDDLNAVHSEPYLQSLLRKQTVAQIMDIAIPSYVNDKTMQQRILEPICAMVAGTALAADTALTCGFAVNIGGGFLHAKVDEGNASFIINDVAYAVYCLRKKGFTGNVVVISTDANQCDGVHSHFRHDDTVTTFSLFQADAFPLPKVNGDVDVPVSAAIDDDEYLDLLEQHLPSLLKDADPQLVIHIAGADVLKSDPATDLSLSEKGLVRRDMFVAGLVRCSQIPFVHLLGSGFGPKSWRAQARSIKAMVQEYFLPAG